MIKLIKLKGKYNTGTYIDPDNIAYIVPKTDTYQISFKESTGFLLMQIDIDDLERILNMHDVYE